jgi:hypothetical protein
MPAITMTSERTGHWTKMRRPFVPFSGSGTSRHKRSSVGFITATFGFRFSVHTRGIDRPAPSNTLSLDHSRRYCAFGSRERLGQIIAGGSNDPRKTVAPRPVIPRGAERLFLKLPEWRRCRTARPIDPHAPGIGQGRTAPTRCSTIRIHRHHANSVRIAS